jgi:hypothetical protein
MHRAARNLGTVSYPDIYPGVFAKVCYPEDTMTAGYINVCCPLGSSGRSASLHGTLNMRAMHATVPRLWRQDSSCKELGKRLRTRRQCCSSDLSRKQGEAGSHMVEAGAAAATAVASGCARGNP